MPRCCCGTRRLTGRRLAARLAGIALAPQLACVRASQLARAALALRQPALDGKLARLSARLRRARAAALALVSERRLASRSSASRLHSALDCSSAKLCRQVRIKCFQQHCTALRLAAAALAASRLARRRHSMLRRSRCRRSAAWSHSRLSASSAARPARSSLALLQPRTPRRGSRRSSRRRRHSMLRRSARRRRWARRARRAAALRRRRPTLKLAFASRGAPASRSRCAVKALGARREAGPPRGAHVALTYLHASRLCGATRRVTARRLASPQLVPSVPPPGLRLSDAPPLGAPPPAPPLLNALQLSPPPPGASQLAPPQLVPPQLEPPSLGALQGAPPLPRAAAWRAAVAAWAAAT
jgi:hypothetical protein